MKSWEIVYRGGRVNDSDFDVFKGSVFLLTRKELHYGGGDGSSKKEGISKSREEW